MTCEDCAQQLTAKREAAVVQLSLPRRCLRCQSQYDRPIRVADCRGYAHGAEYDSSREHFRARQGDSITEREEW